MEPGRTVPGWLQNKLQQAYALLLRAYPAPFRQVYSSEMSEVFADLLNDTAPRGSAPLLWLAAREGWQTFTAILRHYWSIRSGLVRRAWDQSSRLIHFLLTPDPTGSPDGRTSLTQSLLEITLFGIIAVGLVVATYMPVPVLKPLTFALSALTLVLPLPWLLVGLARGLPRWAYPVLGMLAGVSLFAALAARVFLLFGILFLAGIALLLWAYFVDHHKPYLPPVFQSWRLSLASDPTRLSFGFYGLLPLAIIAAFDNAYANNRTAWLAVAALGMLIGAFAYTRSQKMICQMFSLTAGVTLAFCAALIDHFKYAGISFAGPVWIYSLWIEGMVLVLAPALAARRLRFLHDRFSSPAQGS
jgi:hypothetical protein